MADSEISHLRRPFFIPRKTFLRQSRRMVLSSHSNRFAA
jgi:hypothetical protein